MYFNGTALPDGIDSFVRLGLEVHLIWVALDDACQVGLDRLVVGTQLGALANHCNISICKLVPR